MKAPAKLNLHLEVGKKSEDGFHDINSLFIMVDLFDEISLSSLKTGNDCRISGKFNCKKEDNLIYRAWQAFSKASGIKTGVEFSVLKRIPSFAGMGGGSSDAAAALKALNELFDRPLPFEILKDIAKRTGSDVPFFLSGPAVLAGGKGGKIKRLFNPRALNFVVVRPEIDISTSLAYGWLDESDLTVNSFMDSDNISGIYYGDLKGYNRFYNSFTDILCEKYEIFSNTLSLLNESGAVYSNITGSGSAVFGLYNSEGEAEYAQKKLKNSYKFVQKINSLDRIPIAILE